MRSAFMTEVAVSPPSTIDLEDLGLDGGGHLLIERALGSVPVGGQLAVHGRDPALGIHLAAWARRVGHQVSESSEDRTWVLRRGSVDAARWHDAERAGGP